MKINDFVIYQNFTCKYKSFLTIKGTKDENTNLEWYLKDYHATTVNNYIKPQKITTTKEVVEIDDLQSIIIEGYPNLK